MLAIAAAVFLCSALVVPPQPTAPAGLVALYGRNLVYGDIRYKKDGAIMEGQGWFNSDADGMQNLVEGTLHRTKFDLVIKWPHNNSVLPPAFEVTVGIDIDTSEEAVRARVALAPPSRRER